MMTDRLSVIIQLSLTGHQRKKLAGWNDWIHAITEPSMPNERCRRWMRMSWSTQSNAALRSRRPSSVMCWWSAVHRMSDKTR